MLEVKVYDPRFYEIINVDSELTLLSDEFMFTEGPIWDAKEQSLTFSDVAASKTYRYTASNGFCVLRENTNKANGNAYDENGNILVCEHATSHITRTNAAGKSYEVLASHYQGKELNSPNDIIVRSDGLIYFSDPRFGRKPTWIGVGREMELDFQGVFALNPKTKELTLATKECVSPNGLCFSPDESRMYVADSPEHKIFEFDVAEDGTLQHKRLFADTSFEGVGSPDGLKVDKHENVYCAAQGGLHVYAPDGTRLGIVLLPKQTANFCFGGQDGKTIFITAVSSIYTVQKKI